MVTGFHLSLEPPSALSVALAIEHFVVAAVIVAAVAVGIWYIVARVPTREAVLASRGRGPVTPAGPA